MIKSPTFSETIKIDRAHKCNRWYRFLPEQCIFSFSRVENQRPQKKQNTNHKQMRSRKITFVTRKHYEFSRRKPEWRFTASSSKIGWHGTRLSHLFSNIFANSFTLFQKIKFKDKSYCNVFPAFLGVSQSSKCLFHFSIFDHDGFVFVWVALVLFPKYWNQFKSSSTSD